MHHLLTTGLLAASSTAFALVQSGATDVFERLGLTRSLMIPYLSESDASALALVVERVKEITDQQQLVGTLTEISSLYDVISRRLNEERCPSSASTLAQECAGCQQGQSLHADVDYEGYAECMRGQLVVLQAHHTVLQGRITELFKA